MKHLNSTYSVPMMKVPQIWCPKTFHKRNLVVLDVVDSRTIFKKPGSLRPSSRVVSEMFEEPTKTTRDLKLLVTRSSHSLYLFSEILFQFQFKFVLSHLKGSPSQLNSTSLQNFSEGPKPRPRPRNAFPLQPTVCNLSPSSKQSPPIVSCTSTCVNSYRALPRNLRRYTHLVFHTLSVISESVPLETYSKNDKIITFFFLL